MTSSPTGHNNNAPPPPDWPRLRPIDASYWVVPGRLLVGEHPAARSRAQSMVRLRAFLESGTTCFIDLTELQEMAGYEMLLPFETPTGRRVEYLREPIPDHGVPADRETMDRILAMLDSALDSGHCVYLHCRAGIGRSAMAAGCWLAERNAGGGAAALLELTDLWQQCSQSRSWSQVPETPAQVEFVRSWQALRTQGHKPAARVARAPRVQAPMANAVGGTARQAAVRGTDTAQRLQGAWYGLALGDALSVSPSTASTNDTSLVWSQHTALALCLAESLSTLQRTDARDQIERYWRWFKEGQCAADGAPGETMATPDVTKALATYRWRHLPMAGSHDPRDVAATSLPRVLAAVSHEGRDIAAAIALAAECSRTTHQSPLILDACRAYAAMLAGAIHGQPAPACLHGVPEPVTGCWVKKPLRKDLRTVFITPPPGKPGAMADVLQVLVLARRIVAAAVDFESAIAAAQRNAGVERSPLAALVGTLYGALHGIGALPAAGLARLAGREQLERVVRQGVAQQQAGRGVQA